MPTHYDEVIERVRGQANLGSDGETEHVTIAVLSTLGERLSEGQVRDLADELPEDLAGMLTDTGVSEARSFSAEEFVDRVRERESEVDAIEDDDARRHVQAVFLAVSESVSDEAWSDLDDQLPAEYGELYTVPGQRE
ncbi:DUF2267 domain-containing protein [Natronorarus salvus]|uniref:DUF2267 domain-containing protein n=1 Tax=Natronorarus salvus TaxID=3117733 RepID=UPI002F261B64